MADAEEVVEEYRSSLTDLTINSKPLISMLTMLAEDHSQYAQHIVQLIEQHLQKVKPSQKLPVLYLIDSIIKNLTEYSYSRLFSKNVVSIFCDTFQKVDERTRGAMYKLRQTWQMYFPNPKLYALDMRVNMMDPAWPIIAEAPEQGNIHVNPRFLVQKEEDEGPLAEQPETLMRKQLIAKQQKLLGVLQHRMEHEVADPHPKVDAVSHKPADNFSKQQDDDLSVISDPAAHSMKASAIRSLPSMVSSKPVMPKTYSPADTTSTTIVSNFDSAKNQKNKLPLPKIDPELPIPKNNEVIDLPTSQLLNTHLPPSTTTTTSLTGLSMIKVRDPRLTRDPRLASRDPRNQLALNRRVVLNEGSSAAEKTPSAVPTSTLELTSKPPTISSSLLSNMRSLDAVRSHSNMNVVTNMSKNKCNEIVPAAKKNEGNLDDKRVVIKDSSVDNYNQFKAASTSISSEQQVADASVNDYKEANRQTFDVDPIRQAPIKFQNTSKTGMVTAADFDKPFSSNLEDKNKSEPDMEIISSTIEITDDMSNKTQSDSDDVQFLSDKNFTSNDKVKGKSNDRNFSRIRDRRRGSDDSDKSRRRDDSRDRSRYSRDSRSSRRDDDRRSRYRDDDYRDRNTDRFGRERRRSKDRLSSRRKERYDSEEHDRYRRRRERSPIRNRSPENMSSRSWQLDNERKSYKDSKGETWKSLYDNSDNQLSNDSNQNSMGARNCSSIKNHRHGSVSPKDHLEDKSNTNKGLKRDRDYRDNSKVPSSKGEHDAPVSPKRICTDQGMGLPAARPINTKEDISDLFGKVDQDYRVPPSNMNDQRIPYMRSDSHSGWAKFKAAHPDDFISDEGGTGAPRDIDERYKDVDMRMNNCVASPMKFSRVVDGPTKDKQANFILGAAKLAQSGKISHEEHQLVLKQMDRIQKMTYEAGKITENYRVSPERENSDDHRFVEQAKQMPKWPGNVSDMSSDTNSRSPLRDNNGNAPHILACPLPNQDGDMRNVQVPRMAMNVHTPLNHPNDLVWSTTNMHPDNVTCDLRWKGNIVLAENEVSGEVLIDHKPYEIVPNGKPRKIKLNGKMFEIHADPHERAIFVNNSLCYRFGEVSKDVQLDGQWHQLHYQGQLKSVWVDQQRYDVRVDAPPRRLVLDKEDHSLQIDGRDMMIFIDRIEQGIYGGPPRNIFVKNVCHEIRFDPPPRQILIDGKPCELKLNCRIPFVVIDGKPHGIRFDGPPREIIVDDTSYLVPVDKPIKIRLGRRPHILAFGGPAHEVIIDGKWFEVRFDGPPVEVHLGNRSHSVMLKGASPNVKILGELPTMFSEPNRPQLSFNGANMFPPAAPMINDFSRPRGPHENFQHRPPQWDLPFIRRPNHPEPITMIRPFAHDRQLENLRFPGHPVLPPGVIGPGPMQPLSGPAPFYHGLPPNLSAITLPPMNTLPPGMAPMNPDTNSNSGAPVQPQFPQITLTSTGLASVSCPGMPSMPTAPTALTTAGSVPNIPPNLAAVTAAAAAPPNLLPPPLPTSLLNKLVRPPMLPLSQPPPHQPPHPVIPAPPIDVSALFQKLVNAGMISTATTTTADKEKEKEKEKTPEKEKEPEPEVIPDLFDFKIEKLKTVYTRFADELYEGIQCSSCGIRFTVDDTEKYREHLDWHFRQNKREKDDYKVAKYRKWYYEMSEWIQYEENQGEEEKNRSNFFENMLNPVQEPSFVGSQGNKLIQCPAAIGNDTDDVCDICGDPFEQFWEEEEEEWHLRNAVRVEGKTYHPVCYEDVKESVDVSSIDTPKEIIANNPLETASQIATAVPVTNTTSLASNITSASTTTTASTNITTATPITTTTDPASSLITAPTLISTTNNKNNNTPVTCETSTGVTAATTTTMECVRSTPVTTSVSVLSSAINPALATNLPSSTLSNILAAVASSEKSTNALASLLADAPSQLSPHSPANADNNVPGNNNASPALSASNTSTANELNIVAQPITTIVSTLGLKAPGL